MRNFFIIFFIFTAFPVFVNFFFFFWATPSIVGPIFPGLEGCAMFVVLGRSKPSGGVLDRLGKEEEWRRRRRGK